MVARSEFLSAVFDGREFDEHAVFSPNFKGKYVDNERGLRLLDSHDDGWLYCVSSVRWHGGRVHSRLRDLRRAYVLPLDDIGTKSRAPSVEPSYILETSEGNYQYGYLLEPYDVSNDRGANYYDGCLRAMAEAGYNDQGCIGAHRMIKMPGAINHKNKFVTRVTKWSPELRYSLKKLMKQFGVKAQRVSRKSAAEGHVSDLRNVKDPLYDWLVERGVKGHNDTFVYITCPWEFEHSSRGVVSGTGYSPLDYGVEGRQFKCMHGHCAQRGMAELLQWAATQGFDVSGLDDLEVLHNRLLRSAMRGYNNRRTTATTV